MFVICIYFYNEIVPIMSIDYDSMEYSVEVEVRYCIQCDRQVTSHT